MDVDPTPRAASPSDGPAGRGPRKPVFIGAVALLGLAHAAGLALIFEPIGGLISAEPLIEQDYALHFHHLRSIEAFWRADRRLWGYNPYFMAGYPSNTVQDASVKLYELAAMAAPGMDAVVAFKGCVLAAHLAIPWLAWGAGLAFFGRGAAAAVAACLGTLLWWNGLPREMFFYGMVGFPIAGYGALLALGVLHRLWSPSELRRTDRRLVRLVAFVLAALLPPLHLQSIAIVGPPLAFGLLNLPKGQGARAWGGLIALGSFGLVVNAAWLAPFLSHMKDARAAELVAELPVFTVADRWGWFKDYVSASVYWSFRSGPGEKPLRLYLLLIGGAGLATLGGPGRRGARVLLATCAGGMFALAYFGSWVAPLKAWQPLRFKLALDLALALAAAPLMARAFVGPMPKWARAGIAAATLAAALGAAINIYLTEAKGDLRLRTRLGPTQQALIAWARDAAPRGGRILFEESGDESGFVHDGVYLSAILAHEAKRELIGGPSNLYNDRHHFAEFHAGRAFGKEVHALGDDALRAYLDLYNIVAIAAFSPTAVERLLALKEVIRPEGRIGPVHLLRVDRPGSWFERGSGRLAAGFNRIELTDLRGDDVILKYHWVEGLAGDPPARIEPVRLLDDPIPFIRILEPPSALTLRVGRRQSLAARGRSQTNRP